MYSRRGDHFLVGEFGGYDYGDFGGGDDSDAKDPSGITTTGSVTSDTPTTSTTSIFSPSAAYTGNPQAVTRSRLSDILTQVITGRPDTVPVHSTINKNILQSERPDSYDIFSTAARTGNIDTTTSTTTGSDKPITDVFTRTYELISRHTTDLVTHLNTSVTAHSGSQAQTPERHFTSHTNIFELFNSTNISWSELPETEFRMCLGCTHIIHDIVLPVVIAIGILGNAAAFLVLMRRIFRLSATARLLIGLTASAFLHCVIEVPHLLCSDKSLYASEGFQVFYRHYLIARNALNPILLSAVTCLTVAVVLERFLSLRYPFSPSMHSTVPEASKTILGVFVAVTLFHLSKSFEYAPNPDLSSAEPLIATELLRIAAYKIFRQYVNTTLTVTLPYVVLFVLLLLLVIAISNFRSQCKKSFIGQSSTGDASHMTSGVVAMATMFLLCNSLSLYLATNITVYGSEKTFSSSLNVELKELSEVMIFVYMSLPFILFCAICRNFRKATCCCGSSNSVGFSTDVSQKNSRSNSTFTGIGVSNCSLDFV
ncbi:uncharacterized protein LOC106153056 [Lingula anatina]|uniref:Uncharacterized protein LOC106153056 n=1 Tax=Lingula anatina TaxID=7574 RepID=A0A1S3HAX2_LINAN|nr:uncharacterized protein LOC106153056 [Lingula anatina]|eukprot:XP_013382279.2 uncharacterized protein LOC106153056 [Lingula anatina]